MEVDEKGKEKRPFEEDLQRTSCIEMGGKEREAEGREAEGWDEDGWEESIIFDLFEGNGACECGNMIAECRIGV